MNQAPLLIKIPVEHLPATICSFLVKPGDKITKSQSLLSYEYKKIIQERPVSSTGESESKYVDVLTPQIEELKSPTEGELEQFHVKPGETIDKKE
jgi:biotin carboxyl carrier protein